MFTNTRESDVGGQDGAVIEPGANNAHWDVKFRDPPPVEDQAGPIRLEIARLLVRAPTLPVEIPKYGLTLLDIEVPRHGVELVLGFDAPVASLRLTPVGSSAQRGPDGRPVVDVQARTRHKAGERYRNALEVMAQRVRQAVTVEQWQQVMQLASQLRKLPVGVPLGFFRQAVAGVDFLEGIVRTGFRCNQDCGMCWQGRQWGDYGSDQVMTWIEDLGQAGVRGLIISGGEPTLDKRIVDYIKLARSFGIQSVTIETNAITCAKPGKAEMLRDAGLTGAFVSLHSGDAKVSDAITRAPGTHQRTVQGILRLMDAGVPVRLNAVLSQEGLEHLPALPDFVHETFGHRREMLRGLMISYPSEPYDETLTRGIVPDPIRLRHVLKETIDRAAALNLDPHGLDGPCGPPLCAFGADVRVASLKPLTAPVNFRRQIEPCNHCAVQDACFGVRPADVETHGNSCVAPLTRIPTKENPIAPGEGQSLLLNLSYFCNAKCPFCMVYDALNRPELDMTDHEIDSALRAAREQGAREVGYTGGEPTIHKRFIEICAQAKSLGFTEQQVTTNGIKFKDFDFCKQSIEAGLSSIDISIHGHTDELHDKLVARKNALKAVRKACENFVTLKQDEAFAKAHPFHVGATVVIVRENAGMLRDICEYLVGLGIEYIRLKYAYAADTPREEIIQQVPPYDHVVPNLAEAIDYMSTTPVNFGLRHIPLCLLGDMVVFAKDFENRNVKMAFHESHEEGDPAQRARDDASICDGCVVASFCTRLHTAYEAHHGRPRLTKMTTRALRDQFDEALQRLPQRGAQIERTWAQFESWQTRERTQWKVFDNSLAPKDKAQPIAQDDPREPNDTLHLSLEAEGKYLSQWMRAFSEVYGAAPKVEPLICDLDGAPEGLRRLRFSNVFDQPDLIGSIGHFGHCDAMVSHVRTLGFDWDDTGRILTIPTPASFNALLPLLGIKDAGYSLGYMTTPSEKLPLGPWLLNYFAGTLPLHVCSPNHYKNVLTASSGSNQPDRGMRFHFASFVHDMSVHALNYHLIPHGCITDMRQRVEEMLPERVTEWSKPEAMIPLTLSFFLDNDLNRYCYRVWCMAKDPEDFRRIFARPNNYIQLMSALDIRIEETRQGKGDVPSGDTDDMPPITQTEFNLTS